jgi:hypothetical protein
LQSSNISYKIFKEKKCILKKFVIRHLVSFQIRITAVRGSDTTGYVALDDFLISSVDSCDVLPPEADPTRCPDGKFTCKNGECIDEVKK